MTQQQTHQHFHSNKVVERVIPWALFLGMLVWSWRVRDLFHSIPAYGDTLEILWGMRWYAEQLSHFRSPAMFPLIFYPNGLNVAILAHTPATFIALIPLYLIGGEAFAYNVATLFSLFVAFAGMYRLARKFNSAWIPATLAALLFTFWGYRWIRIGGHLHVMISSALLPWLVLMLERALNASRRAHIWFAIAGAIWAAAIVNMYYFAWIDGIIIATWTLVRVWHKNKRWSMFAKDISITSITALLLSAPVIITFFRAKSAAGASFHDVTWVNSWGASVNSLPSPSVFHPYLNRFAHWIYHGPVDESGVINLGTLAFVVAFIGLLHTLHNRKWYPVYWLVAAGLTLALGFTIRWNGNVVQCKLCQPVNQIIWQVGHFLKPEFFTTKAPPQPLDHAFPLPGLLLAAIVPLWEGARTLSRYIFVAATGFFLLVAQGIQRFKAPLLQVAIAALLLFEVLPFRSGSVPASPLPHPAFEWINQNTLPEDTLIDLTAISPDLLMLPIRGEILWATRYHERATVAGVGSYLPDCADSLFDWLLQHPHAFQNPEFIPMLQRYQVDYILLHMEREDEGAILDEARDNKMVEVVDCFEPPPPPSPWSYPICVMRILPSE